MFRTRVKICCIQSKDEIDLAVKAGVDAVGLVGDMPTGPGIITDKDAEEFAAHTGMRASTFLLTSQTTARGIATHIERVKPSTVQIVKHVDPDIYPNLKEQIGLTKLVQVLHVEDESILALMESYVPYVDGFLLDSGRPSRAEFGGTGRTHDWGLSTRIVKESPKPVFLAGGLNPDNVREAIETVRPFGVDICSGLRPDKVHLDPHLLATFMEAVRLADT